MMTTLHQVNDLSRVGEKPACCIGAARGHCTVHCPRIEDVLYSQRKGKTNKGAQRWRCKACGTKWTSKGIIQPPPVVPDTIVNSIGFGSGPEELSIDQLRANTRPYKKTKTMETMIPTTPFPSLFNSANITNNNINNNNNNNNNNNIHNGNSSPNGSPIPSPPSPVSYLTRTTNSFVPILPTTTSSSSSTSNNNNNNSIISNSISNSVINTLRQSQNSTSSLSSTIQQQLSQSSQNLNNSRPSQQPQLSQSTSSLSTSKNSLTTKPVVVGIPGSSNQNNNLNSSNNNINNSPSSNLQILGNNNNNNNSNSPSSKTILYSGQPSPQSPQSNNNNTNNNNNGNNNINSQNLANGIQRPSLQTYNKPVYNKQSPSPSPNNNNNNNTNSNSNNINTSPQPPLSPKSLKLYQINKSNQNTSSSSLQQISNQSPKNNISSSMIHSTYGQPTPPPTKPPVSSKAPAVYHNVRIPSPTIDNYQQQHQYQNSSSSSSSSSSQQPQQMHHLQQNPSQPSTPSNNSYQSIINQNNNQSSIVINRHNDLLSPVDSQIWAPIQYSWVQTHYNPSQTLLESLKRLVNSIVVFSNEINVEHRLKLINFLNILGSPSSETQYNTPSSKTVLSCIDSSGFNITRHYQMLYQTISKHHSMMEDQFVPLTEVYFDENEINRFLIFSEQAQSIEENFEFILRELSNIRDSFIMKRENIEKNIVESSKMISYNHSTLNTRNSSTNSDGTINLEQVKLDAARLLETLAPLETTLNGMETKFKSIQREISMVQRVFSFFELLYNIHITYHQSIIEKHSRQLSTYIVDVIQQTLFNCDVLSVAYNKMKQSLNQINNNNDDELIDTSNPFINKLNELLNKYENIRSSNSSTSSSNSINNNHGQLSHQSSSNNLNNLNNSYSNNNSFSSLYNQTQQPRDKKVLAVYHQMCLDHLVPEDHPESPKRLQAVIRAINEFSKHSDRLIIKNDPEEASDKWILTVHSAEYLKQLDDLTDKLESNEIRPLNVKNDGAQTGINHFNNNINNNGSDCEDGDTFVSKLSLRAAKRSAGATLFAIDSVMKGNVTSAFVAARPPGHHAGRDGLTSGTSSQGFCLLNHVCIGAKYAQLKYNLEKIAIIDFDVHHGNGTEDILANDQGFYFLSIHMFEEGFYPGSGGGTNSLGVLNYNELDNENNSNSTSTTNSSISSNNNNSQPSSNVVNIPLDPKSSANSFLKAFSVIIDKLNDYQPELILISCGFDAHLEDHLASLCLLEDNYVEITRQLRKVADRWCKGRLVSVLEGGYNINALRQCTLAHLSALVED